MIDKSSLKYIYENREILIREENYAYIAPCDQLGSLFILRAAVSVDELLLKLEEKLISSIQFGYSNELLLAVKDIIQTEGVISSGEISKNTFYCTRHLNRLFNIHLGMSVKAFSKLVRINKAIELLNVKENTLDFICNKLGYYDTSHLVKDFKTVCDITPQEYRTNMSDFYSEIAKF